MNKQVETKERKQNEARKKQAVIVITSDNNNQIEIQQVNQWIKALARRF